MNLEETEKMLLKKINDNPHKLFTARELSCNFPTNIYVRLALVNLKKKNLVYWQQMKGLHRFVYWSKRNI